jgi:hypothetical protein
VTRTRSIFSPVECLCYLFLDGVERMAGVFGRPFDPPHVDLAVWALLVPWHPRRAPDTSAASIAKEVVAAIRLSAMVIVNRTPRFLPEPTKLAGSVLSGYRKCRRRRLLPWSIEPDCSAVGAWKGGSEGVRPVGKPNLYPLGRICFPLPLLFGASPWFWWPILVAYHALNLSQPPFGTEFLR